MSYSHLPDDPRSNPSQKSNQPQLTRITSQTVDQMKNSVKNLITSTSLNEVFSTRYRRQVSLALIAYLAIGIGYYCGQEGFSFLNAIYFIVITVFTIGYGDYVPNTSSQRLFTCFFIIFGVILVSACIGSITEILYDIHERGVHERVRKAAIKMQNVSHVDVNSNVIDFLDVSHKRRKSLHKSIDPESKAQPSISSRYTSSESIATMFRNSIDTLGIFGRLTEAEEEVEEKMVNAMQKLNMDMFDEELRDLANQSKINLALIIGVVSFGVFIMLWIEDWTFIDSLYWAIVTISTVGFGDVVPETRSGKAFTIVFCLAGCSVLAFSVNNLIRYPLIMKAKQSELKVMMQFGGQLSEDTLRSMLASDFFDRIPNLRQSEESLTKSEFILLLLSMMAKINDKDVLIVSKIFDMLDEQKQNVLSAENILTEIKKAQEREEIQRAEEEYRQRKYSGTSGGSASNGEYLHVKSLKNIATNFKSRMVKSNSDFRRSSAPTVFGRINSPSSDVYNPLSNSTHDVKQLQRPLVDASDDIPDDTAGSDDLRDTYLSPSIPPYSDSAAVTRLFKSQSESGTPRASPGPSASPAPGLSPYYPPLPPSQSTSLRGLFQEDSPTETADRSP